MKLIAIFQILILLTSVVVPEGAYRVVRGCSCGDNCQCSSETKQSGACCCGTKASEPDAKPGGSCCQSKSKNTQPACCSTPAKTTSVSCCPKTDSSKSRFCSTQGNHKSCESQNRNPSHQRQPSHEPVEDKLSSTCGCTEVIIHLTVVLMPRLRPSTVCLDDSLFFVDRLPLVSDSTLTNSRLPEVPPPQNRLSETTTNSFAA